MTERQLRVLLVTNHYPPDVNPSGKLMHKLAEGLRERGFVVDVLTTFPHYESFRVGAADRGKLVAHEGAGGGRVTRVWAHASGQKQNMLHRLANYVSFNVMATLTGAFARRRYDVILANSGSFFTGISAWLLGLFPRTPFVYNVQDIYPDVPVRAGQLRNRAAIRALEMIERFMYDRARHITVISQQQRQVLEAKGVPAARLTVIPNFVDTSFIRPLPKDNEVSRRLELHDKFVIAHAGNLGYAYDFGSVLDAAGRLRAHAGLLFVIIGDGVRHSDLAQQIAARQLTNVRMIPFQPEADLPMLRGAIDVQLALYTRGAIQSSLPSKIYEIMASGRPAIVGAEADSDLVQLVQSTASGLCIDPENVDQLEGAVLRLYRDPATARAMGERGRAAVLDKYSKESAVAAYAELLRGIAH
jgi:colanic acid biosynthesis glycosyl transferase WcaI